jgi:hypothetical protein
MFKGLLILGIIIYLLMKVGSMFYRAGASSQQRGPINPPPGPAPKSEKKPGGIKGGEYIDYEEVK